ncbi:hypothetical protein NF212_06565 [Parasalinivibrio latis]|uniref:hypothetical protein n=1 Tax=Parasalinivibrio latis TaxID=2952610 RepID=UPI0030DF068D
MTLPLSGPISLEDIGMEFEDTPPHRLTEFYRGGGLVPDNNTGIPTTGPVRLTDFYGGVNEAVEVVTDAPSLSLHAVFGAAWADNVPKRLVVPAGVVVGPITAAAGRQGSLRIDNAGEVQGLGGVSNGGHGGAALTVNGDFSLYNTGTIRGGGGGGGRGGTGGGAREPGSGWYYDPNWKWLEGNDIQVVLWGGTEVYRGPLTYGSVTISGMLYTRGGWHANGSGVFHSEYGVYRQLLGGIGGSGGRGRGYGQTQLAGEPGQEGPAGTGRGGRGGDGGNWGADGGDGLIGVNGFPGKWGGFSGASIHIIGGNVTFIERGTLQGPITALG